MPSFRLNLLQSWVTCVLLLHFGGNHAQAKQQADLILTHGTVVTMDAARRVLEDAAVAVIGETIAAIGTSEQITAAYEAQKTMDVRGALIMPGLINAHHTYGDEPVSRAGGRPVHYKTGCRSLSFRRKRKT